MSRVTSEGPHSDFYSASTFESDGEFVGRVEIDGTDPFEVPVLKEESFDLNSIETSYNQSKPGAIQYHCFSRRRGHDQDDANNISVQPLIFQELNLFGHDASPISPDGDNIKQSFTSRIRMRGWEARWKSCYLDFFQMHLCIARVSHQMVNAHHQPVVDSSLSHRRSARDSASISDKMTYEALTDLITMRIKYRKTSLKDRPKLSEISNGFYDKSLQLLEEFISVESGEAKSEFLLIDHQNVLDPLESEHPPVSLSMEAADKTLAPFPSARITTDDYGSISREREEVSDTAMESTTSVYPSSSSCHTEPIDLENSSTIPSEIPPVNINNDLTESINETPKNPSNKIYEAPLLTQSSSSSRIASSESMRSSTFDGSILPSERNDLIGWEVLDDINNSLITLSNHENEMIDCSGADQDSHDTSIKSDKQSIQGAKVIPIRKYFKVNPNRVNFAPNAKAKKALIIAPSIPNKIAAKVVYLHPIYAPFQNRSPNLTEEVLESKRAGYNHEKGWKRRIRLVIQL